MRDYGPYERLITPTIIRIVYWVLLALVVIVSFAAFEAHPLAPLLVFVIGVLAVRIYCEVPILIFSINETLVEIKTRTRQLTGATRWTLQAMSNTGSKNFLTFRRFITPDLLQRLFWVVVLAIIVVGVAGLVAAFEFVEQARYGFWRPDPDDVARTIAMGAVAYLVFGVLALLLYRVFAEFVSVIFAINENISDVKELIRMVLPNPVPSQQLKPTLQDFLGFRHMITPVYTQFWYSIVTIFAVFAILWGGIASAMATGSVATFLLTLLILVIVVLLIRIVAELAIVPFRINENLTDLRNITSINVGAHASAEGQSLADFLAFRHMITTNIIQMLYWIVTVAVVAVIGAVAISVSQGGGGFLNPGLPGFREGGLLLVVGLVIYLVILLLSIRIYAEQYIVMFRINETLTDIRNRTSPRTGTGTVNQSLRIADLMSFQRMVAPILMQALYWALTALIVIGSFVLLIEGSDLVENAGLRFLIALAILVVGLPVLRVFAEGFIVAFRINETLTDIRNGDINQLISPTAPTKTCPYCAEDIPNDDIQCRFCGSALPARHTGTTGTTVPVAPTETTTATKPCPFCAEPISQAETNCPYCGSILPNNVSGTAAPAMPATPDATQMKSCPYCAETIPVGEINCRYCGSQLPNE